MGRDHKWRTEGQFANCECSFSIGAVVGVRPTHPPGPAKSRTFGVNPVVIPASRIAPAFSPERKQRIHTKACRPGGMRHFRGMSTLAEIEEAVPRLSAAELAEMERFVRECPATSENEEWCAIQGSNL